MTSDEVPPGLLRAQELQAAGDEAGAGQVLKDVWRDASAAGDEYAACVAAHFLGRLPAPLTEQLRWHERALRAADAADERVAGFYPSLHLNLADAHRQLGDLESARLHASKALGVEEKLQDDGYGRMIRSGIRRVVDQLGGVGGADPGPST